MNDPTVHDDPALALLMEEIHRQLDVERARHHSVLEDAAPDDEIGTASERAIREFRTSYEALLAAAARE